MKQLGSGIILFLELVMYVHCTVVSRRIKLSIMLNVSILVSRYNLVFLILFLEPVTYL